MYGSDKLEDFSEYLLNPQKKCYLELARDYLAYFGNKRPSNNQLIVAKNLIIDSTIRKNLNFGEALSLKEMKCLYLAFNGKTIVDSALVLDIHPDTIKHHRKQGIKKLNCRNMSHAAFRSGTLNFHASFYEALIKSYFHYPQKIQAK